jgi:two-component system sensor histidine kinase/response regulator
LFDAIVTALSDSATIRKRRAERKRKRPTMRSLRVLVAEDNVVNQTLARRLLEKLGHKVNVVDDGQQALSAASNTETDLIVMDVQMPHMDGLEATAMIRQSEIGTGRHIPIIALTAHAMKGDRERCLAAGMDGYVSKPIRMEDLEATIASVVESLKPATPPKAPTPVSDIDALLEGVGGDRRLLREMIRIFQADSPEQVSAIAKGLTRKDPVAVQRAAHALKGAIGNFQCEKAFETARKIEQSAAEGNLRAAKQVFAELNREMAHFTHYLSRLSIRLRPKPQASKTRRSRPRGKARKGG